jgi:hypothetical protein
MGGPSKGKAAELVMDALRKNETSTDALHLYAEVIAPKQNFLMKYLP